MSAAVLQPPCPLIALSSARKLQAAVTVAIGQETYRPGIALTHQRPLMLPRGTPATIPVATSKVLPDLKPGFDLIGLATRIALGGAGSRSSRLPPVVSFPLAVICRPPPPGGRFLGPPSLGGPFSFSRTLGVYPDAALVHDS